MQKTFTLNDLAKYSSEIRRLTQRYINTPGREEGPSTLVIRNILQYSKALEVSKSNSFGTQFLLMN